MDIVDRRKLKKEQQKEEINPQNRSRRTGTSRTTDYIEEMIREAQLQGKFDNLSGTGKPLALENFSEAGDNALAYRMLKNGGFVPPEIELVKEIDALKARIDKRIQRVIDLRKSMLSRRMPPSMAERRTFNATVEKATIEYEEALRKLNSRILTLNISAPPSMHRPLLEVEKLVKEFQTSCPMFFV